MRYQGRITRWHDERGFGYITPHGSGDDLFVHVRALSGWRTRPAVGEIVTYGHARDARGRPCAAAVRRVDLRPARMAPRPATPDRGVGWLPAGFMAALVAAVVTGRLPIAVPAACAVVSALTFVVYALDKSAARQGRWRTREQTLHLLALAGGWPGALAAQRLLRHKSRKASFRGVFWLTVLANVAGVAWLASARGAAFLEALRHG
ncbi:MAG TPA: cold shock and DUF1294 domain-containing protein [Frateuria sp.]|uniref:cold shock and DUF1294 domain-containing protein n=1 Tax=Frateuria sp. TaxID=2211372 RepID=UPI002D808FE5|nr:cold shock and DUF1294 domain-containing protein [Frateuria sp.]HET6805291.1 cold shock and DUF1294 domain-containing protein [Frateuria sp.]